MPVPVQAFQPLTFQQANPWMSGANAGLDLFGKGMQTAYLPKQLEQQAKNAEMVNALKQIELKYAPEMTQAELGYKQAQTPYLQQQTRQLSMSNDFYPRVAESGLAAQAASTNEVNTMLPLRAQQLSQQNQFYPEVTRSQIGAQNAMANWRNMGGAGMGVGQKEILGFQRQLMNEHPDWNDQQIDQAASAYLDNKNTLPDGTTLPELSGTGKTMAAQILKRNSPAAIQTQAASLANTANELNAIDISPVKKFAGLSGRTKYLLQKSNLTERTEDWREYDAFKNSTQILAMDTLRKGFGTSVVPQYVYETLGRLSNPNDGIWDDAEQVERKWNKLTEWVNKSAENTSKQARQGATVNLDNGLNETKSSTQKVRKVVRGADGKLAWGEN